MAQTKRTVHRRATGASRDPGTSGDQSPVRLSGRWLTLARAVWILAALAYIAFWALGTYERMLGPLPDCARVVCDNIEFSAGDVGVLRQLDLPAFIDHRVWHALEIPYSIGFFAVAGLIYWRRSDQAVGLLLSAALIYAGAVLFSGADDPLRRSYPELRSLVSAFDILGLAALVAVLLTFPNGRLVGRWAPALAAAFIVVAMTVPLFAGGSSRLQGPEVPPIAVALWLLLFVAMIAVGLISQIYRYRYVSSPLQRQQTKWVVFGLSGQLMVVLIWGYLGYAYPPSAPSAERVVRVLVATPVILLFSSLVPVSVAFAILRYRLFDIDRLINRALVYGLLTGLLALLYFAAVVMLQAVFGSLGLGRSPLAVVLSTLAIAAGFAPLRRRVQVFIDRRFYRRRYDLQKTLKLFGSQMREKVQLDTLLLELLDATERALQPKQLSLWVRQIGPRNSD